MSGRKRNLIFWGKSIEQYFWIVLLVAMVTGVILSMMQSEWEVIQQSIPLILGVSIVAIAYNNITLTMPQVLSMGATRRDALWGMQIFYHLMVIQNIIVTGIVVHVIPNSLCVGTGDLQLFFIAFYLVCCVFGHAVNIITMQGKRNTVQIIYIIALAVTCVTEVIVITAGKYVVIPMLGNISLVVIIVAIVLDVVLVFVSKNAIMNYEVRV